MKTMNPLAAVVASILIAAATPAGADILFYEDFAVPGTTTGEGEDAEIVPRTVRWTGTGCTYRREGMHYTDSEGKVLAVGGGAVIADGHEGDSAMSFADIGPEIAKLDEDLTPTVFVSAIAKKEAGTGRFFNIALFQGPEVKRNGGEICFVGQISDYEKPICENWMIGLRGSDWVREPSRHATTEEAFFVLRVDFDLIAGEELLSLYINPPLSAEPKTPDATLVCDIADLSGWKRVRIGAGGVSTAQKMAGTRAIFDEIRIGTTYADVCPQAVPVPPSETGGGDEKEP